MRKRIKTSHILPLSIRRAIKYYLEAYLTSPLVEKWLEKMFDECIAPSCILYDCFSEFMSDLLEKIVDESIGTWELIPHKNSKFYRNVGFFLQLISFQEGSLKFVHEDQTFEAPINFFTWVSQRYLGRRFSLDEFSSSIGKGFKLP